MHYPYKGWDLFTHPESYEYARCEELDFFVAWQQSRLESCQQIGGQVFDANSEPALKLQKRGTGISLSVILESILAGKVPSGIEASTSKKLIDLLVQKFEVFRRLFDAYTPQLRRAPDAATATLSEYVEFGHVLAHFASIFENAQYLSTLLKLCDALCSAEARNYPPAVAVRLVSLLEREAELVEKFKRKAADAHYCR